jgi:RNA polymerase sigma-70 factor (ECF subfamily)
MERDRPPHTVDRALDEAWREHRQYLLDLAFRMLGRITDAEDAVQEAFTRLMRTDTDAVADVKGWLIVVVSRLCLDQLRSAHARHEETTSFELEPSTRPESPGFDPADRVTLDDSVRMALVVVLERLTPGERAAFVLHDVFQFSFESVASILGKSPAAARQLASRARRRVQDTTGPSSFDLDLAAQRQVAERFIAACASGDPDVIMRALDPDVVGEADFGGEGSVRTRRFEGRDRVAKNAAVLFGPRSGRTLVSQPVNGQPGVLAFLGDQLVGLLTLREREGLIYDIHAIADPAKLALVAAQLG